MATFPGLTLLSNFNFIFTFLFSFSIIFGILEFSHPFGEKKKGIYSIIAFSLSILLVSATKISNIVSFMAPWFVVTIIVVFFIIFVQMMFGVTAVELKDFATKSPYANTITYWIIAIAIIALIFGISLEYGQSVGPYLNNTSSSGSTQGTMNSLNVSSGSTASGNFQQNLGATIFHPKVLGLIAITLIGTFSVRLLSMQM
jgi:hypothetical protein